MKRSGHGQSMVEYALAIGCVAALCMVAIGSLGHLSGHIFHTVEGAIKYPNHTPHPEEMVNLSATPWILH